MATELDEKKLRNELIEVYQRFIENRYDDKTLRNMISLSGKFMYADDLIRNKSLLVPLNNLGFLVQDKLPNGKNHIVEAKDMLRRLKEEK